MKILHKVTYTVAGHEHTGDVIRNRRLTNAGVERIVNRYRNPGAPRGIVTRIDTFIDQR